MMKWSKIIIISIILIILIGSIFIYIKFSNKLNVNFTPTGETLEGISYISFIVSLKNTGNVLLTDFQLSGSPAEFDNALLKCNLNSLSVNEEYYCNTDLIDVDVLPKGEITFSLNIDANYMDKGETKHLSKIISKQVKVKDYENLVLNPKFTDGKTGWDMRYGAGSNGGELGIIDTNIYKSPPASLKIPPSPYVCDTGECDRTIWQNYRIDVSQYRGKRIKLSAWVMHDSCSGDNCWVNPQYAGNTELNNWDCCPQYQCYNPSHFQGAWSCPIVDRGGVRLGMDFRDGNEMFKEYMVIDDWTTKPNEWHKLEIETVVPKDYKISDLEGAPSNLNNEYNTDTVIVWIQGYQYDAPANVWVDDVVLTILDDETNTNYGTEAESEFMSEEIKIAIKDIESVA